MAEGTLSSLREGSHATQQGQFSYSPLGKLSTHLTLQPVKSVPATKAPTPRSPATSIA